MSGVRWERDDESGCEVARRAGVYVGFRVTHADGTVTTMRYDATADRHYPSGVTA